MLRPAMLRPWTNAWRTICALVLLSAGLVRAEQPAPLVALPAGQAQVVVPVAAGGNMLFAAIKINGQEAGYFFLDTGADRVVIDTATADRLKLPIVGQAAATGIAGTQPGTLRRVESLGWGQATVGPQDVVVVDLAAWRENLGDNVAGFLGYPVWRDLPFTIDYRAGTVTFYDRSRFTPPNKAQLEKLSIHAGQPSIPAWLDQRHYGLVVLDTGHQGGLDLIGNFVEKHPEVVARGRELGTSSQGLGGSTDGMIARVDDLRMFGSRWRDVSVAYPLALDKPTGPPAHLGLIGGRLMKHFRLTFDYATERLWVERRSIDPLVGAAGEKLDLNAPDFTGMPPLVLAAFDRDLSTARALIAAGANVNVADRHRFTPLRMAADLGLAELVDELLKAGADENGKNGHPEGPLMVAASRGRTAIVRRLLAAGADPNRRGEDGKTALLVATSGGHVEIVQALLDGKADPKAARQDGVIALHPAAELGHDAIVDLLLARGLAVDSQRQNGGSPLMLAAWKGHAATVQKLLDAGANVNLRDNLGQTPLMFAIEGSSAPVAKILIAHGADVNAKNNAGASTLGLARAKNQPELIDLLVQAGASE